MGENNSDWEDAHLQIVAKMVRVPVNGSNHKQRDTIKNWCGGYDGDVVDGAIDDLLAKGILQRYRSNTIQLVSVSIGEEFIKENDDNGDYTWYL